MPWLWKIACGEEAEKLGELPLPDVEMRHLLGEMIEQRGMMGEREDDGDGEAMGRGKRPRRRSCREGVGGDAFAGAPLRLPMSRHSANSLDLMSRR